MNSVFGALLSVAISILAASSAHAATISIVDGDIYVEGPIESGDFDQFQRAFAQTEGPVSVRLNSPGGNLLEALRIARLVRSAWMVTELPGGMFEQQEWKGLPTPVRCDSACALIFITGAARIYMIDDEVNGRPGLGFHRAFLNPDVNVALDPSSSEREFARANESYLAALAEFGAPQAFVEFVSRTRSDELLLLGATEYYRVFGESRQLGDGIPWLEEYFTAQCGHRLTDAEYSWMDKHRDEAEGKGLHERIYERLSCISALTLDHQDKIRRQLRGTP